MSGFEDENPFADPSVQRATSGVAPGGPSGPPVAVDAAATLDDYNPFDKQKTTGDGGSGPAVMTATTQEAQKPPAYTPSAQQQISTADFQELQRRQEELERRARELERREAELRNAPYNARANNWPPVPSFCPFQPCFYQDINVDIPVEFQKIITYLYYLWIANVSMLFSNLIIGLLFLFAKGDYGQTFGLALFYFIIFTPSSFLCWFRPVYKAFRDDSSFNFMVFFFVFFFQFLMTCLYALGIGSTGSAGLITGIATVSGSENSGFLKFVGVLMVISSIAFAVLALADFLMLVRVHRLYRGTGGSLAKAQAEFTSGVMKNETVQRAAADAAQAQMRNAFAQQPANAQEQPGGVRY